MYPYVNAGMHVCLYVIKDSYVGSPPHCSTNPSVSTAMSILCVVVYA